MPSLVSPPLRVVLDALPLQVRSAGIATYVRELAAALARCDGVAVRLFALPWPAPAPTAPGGIAVVHSPRYPLVMGTPYALPRLLAAESALGEIDVFHATAYAMPRVDRVPVVLTVHDLTLLRRPELGTGALRRSVESAARRANEARLVIADSQATADDLVALAGVAAARVRVVPLGVSAAFRPLPPETARAHVAARFRFDQPYLLHVGTLEPRKNLPLLIAACAGLWRAGRLTHRLILAGSPGWGAAAVADAIARHGAEQFVVQLGAVDAADLPPLYAGADAVVLPSLNEGFGLPLLEALACGAPVIAANAGALPEVAGDAALLVDPADAEAWADAIRRVVTDEELRSRLRVAGPPRAAPFTWERCARETLAVYREAVGA